MTMHIYMNWFGELGGRCQGEGERKEKGMDGINN